MASTRRHTSAYSYAAHTLLLLAMSSYTFGQDFGAYKFNGCYSSSSPLKSIGSYQYQSLGWCQQHCAQAKQSVFGVTAGDLCFCGDELPPESAKTDNSHCNEGCTGYGQELCGGKGYWSVYLSGIKGSAPQSDGTSASGTTGNPSVQTVVEPGKTVYFTKPASASGDGSSSSGGGSNPAAIAAGVVVAIVVASGALAGVFFWLRYRRRRAEEEEYQRNQISNFMRGGENKVPQTSWSSISDSRLDPTFGDKRNSHGSIADNQDFSRKILRVANPDRS